jgi:hypothetical protein
LTFIEWFDFPSKLNNTPLAKGWVTVASDSNLVIHSREESFSVWVKWVIIIQEEIKSNLNILVPRESLWVDDALVPVLVCCHIIDVRSFGRWIPYLLSESRTVTNILNKLSS